MTQYENQIEHLLQQVKSGTLSIQEAKSLIIGDEDISFATLDHFRQKRTGFPEVVYGEGKESSQLITILQSLMKTNKRVLATRISHEKALVVSEAIPSFEYNPQARTLVWKYPGEQQKLYKGYISVVCAGTSDLPVAEEAAVTAELFGCEVKRIYDVGVAGIHRLFKHLDTIESGVATVVVAGMEGALASVIGGLISNPIFAVPTSVGYGANLHGISTLLSMLNSCASGVSVLNIDNGFGGGYNAASINRLLSEGIKGD